MNKELYQKEVKKINDQIKVIKELDSINKHLQKNNWVFLHPYSQVGDIEVLKRIVNESSQPNEEVLNFFGSKFFDLRSTIHFIEGFHNKRPFLKEFIGSIRESVVLCLQKDFRGAITVLMPVFEGTLRKYLVSKNEEKYKNATKIKDLLKALGFLKSDYLQLQSKYLKERNRHFIEANIYLDVNQEKQILKKNKWYFELWMSQFKKFIENNLYLDTKYNIVEDSFNRNIITHGLGNNIDFNFTNYLRIFNLLNYLSWSIGNATEGSSVLSDIHEEEVKTIWADYFITLAVSESLTEIKSNMYSKEMESFSRFLQPQQKKILKLPVSRIRKAIRMYDFLKK